MKKSVLFFLIILLGSSVFAQVRRNVIISEKVKKIFMELFPDYNNVKWEFNGHAFSGTFLRNGRVYGAIFKADTLFADLHEVLKWELPDAVLKHLIKNYPNYTVLGMEILHFNTKPDKNNICFTIDIQKDNINKRVMCYPNGTEISDANIMGGK
jgi:hypothetical protein